MSIPPPLCKVIANSKMMGVSKCGRHSGLLVVALDSGSSGLCSSPGQGNCVLFLDDTLLSQCLSSLRCINGNQRIVSSIPSRRSSNSSPGWGTPKFLKESIKLNWKFQGGRVRLKPKRPSMWGYKYFLEQHNGQAMVVVS